MKVAIIGACSFAQNVAHELSKTCMVSIFSCDTCTCDDECIVSNMHVRIGSVHLFDDIMLSYIQKMFLCCQLVYLWVLQNIWFLNIVLRLMCYTRFDMILFHSVYTYVKTDDPIILQFIDPIETIKHVLHFQSNDRLHKNRNHTSADRGVYQSHNENERHVQITTDHGAFDFDHVFICCARGDGTFVSIVWTSMYYQYNFTSILKQNPILECLTFEGSQSPETYIYCATCKTPEGASRDQVVELLYKIINENIPIMKIVHVHFFKAEKNDNSKNVTYIDEYNHNIFVNRNTKYISKLCETVQRL